FRTDGKGTSIGWSHASAVGEMVERVSAGWFPPWVPLAWHKVRQALLTRSGKLCRLEELDGETTGPAIFRRGLPLVNETAAQAFERRCLALPWLWSPAFSLTEQRDVFFPRDFVEYKDFSRGLAAGNTYAEAILQGLCEVIETHAKME